MIDEAKRRRKKCMFVEYKCRESRSISHTQIKKSFTLTIKYTLSQTSKKTHPQRSGLSILIRSISRIIKKNHLSHINQPASRVWHARRSKVFRFRAFLSHSILHLFSLAIILLHRHTHILEFLQSAYCSSHIPAILTTSHKTSHHFSVLILAQETPLATIDPNNPPINLTTPFHPFSNHTPPPSHLKNPPSHFTTITPL